MTSCAWARSVGYRGPYNAVSPPNIEGHVERCVHAFLIARTSAIGRRKACLVAASANSPCSFLLDIDG